MVSELPHDQDCLFCSIVAGQTESSRVYEDDDVVAFMDLQPVNPGHALVVPRAHFVGLDDLRPELVAPLFGAGHRLARALRRANLRCEGINLFLADGQAAFQEVFHIHLHVFPRFAGDGFRLAFDRYARPRPELDATATEVRAGLAADETAA